MNEEFDPNGPGIRGKIFGLPGSPESASIILLPVPWEVTVSYRTGTAQGPEAILLASSQIDLAHKDIQDVWKLGVAMLPIPHEILEESNRLRPVAAAHIRNFETERVDRPNPATELINEHCENLHIYIRNAARRWLREGKIVGLVGGDHSTPLGLLRALSESREPFGILHLDAHMDLRKAYEGFTYSHGSIMFNALKLTSVTQLVQVGIRDYCENEIQVAAASNGRVSVWFDEDIKSRMFQGVTWDVICDEVIARLPPRVYISFDIDALRPDLCPNTGTPVPGGLDFEQAIYLIKKLVSSGRKVVGFDLNEVSGAEWDAIVGARVLWNMCLWTAVSQRKLLRIR